MHLAANPFGEGFRRRGDGPGVRSGFRLRLDLDLRRRVALLGLGRRLDQIVGTAPGTDDLRQPADQILSADDGAIDLDADALGFAQPLAQAHVAFMDGELQPADSAFGDFGRGDQFRNRRPQRLLVGPQQLQPPIEHDAVSDGQD